MRATQRESIQDYLSRGGHITQCPPGSHGTHHTAAHRKPSPTPTAASTDASWSRYLAQLIHDDQLGAYCAFTLTTHASLDTLRPLLHRRCLRATNLHNPTPRRQLNHAAMKAFTRSQLAHWGTMVFLLPATSAAGHPHFHGFIRTPREYACHTVPMTISEHSRRIEVLVPQEVPFVLGAVRGDDSGNATLRNIHLLNDGTRVILLNDDATARERQLAYWVKTSDGEVRDFANAHFIPHVIRKALPNANTTRERRAS